MLNKLEEHFLYPDITEVVFEDGRKQTVLKGLHIDPEGIFEKSGDLKLSKVQFYGENGIYKAIASWKGSRPKPKSFFPKTWSREDVVEEVLSSLKNLYTEPIEKNKAWVFSGIGKSGVRIKVVIDFDGCIQTTCPIIKKNI